MDVFEAYSSNEPIWTAFIGAYANECINCAKYFELKSFFSLNDNEVFDEFFLGRIHDPSYPPFHIDDEQGDPMLTDLVPGSKDLLVEMLVRDTDIKFKLVLREFIYREYADHTQWIDPETGLVENKHYGEEIENAIEELEEKFTNFSFSYTGLKAFVENWQSKNVNIIVPKKELTLNPTKIKLVSYFDPAIYDIIKKRPDLLKTMDWRLFEEMLADILKYFGYTVELTRATKDGGIDIIAIKQDTHLGAHKYILQAKRHIKSIQVAPVRELLFLHNEHKATKSCLATTTTFTKGAWQEAEKYKWQLELKDRNGILDWVDAVNKIRKKK